MLALGTLHLLLLLIVYSSLSLLRYCWDKKKYNIQTVEISSINLYYFVIVEILIWYHNKQHFELSDIVITRDYCICLLVVLHFMASLTVINCYIMNFSVIYL